MATTSRLALPYPTTADIPNGPAQIQALAEAVDATAREKVYVSSVDTEETRTNTAYGAMATADSVTVAVPSADHIIEILAYAEIKESVANAANVLLDVSGAAQFQRDTGLSTAGVSAGTYGVFFSYGLDYYGAAANLKFVVAGTGLFFPSVFRIKPAASGDKVITLTYKASSGSVTVRNRRIRVKVLYP